MIRAGISDGRNRVKGSLLDVAHVRFGSKADIEARPLDVRFTPKSGDRAIQHTARYSELSPALMTFGRPLKHLLNLSL
jgi:hypothetical protein